MTEERTNQFQQAEHWDSDKSALFAHLVLQQVNAALVFLGKAPHPESGKPSVNLDAAQLYIDTLEMLADRTKGNLEPPENELLQQSLTNLRMAFVDVVSARPTPEASAQQPPPSDKPDGDRGQPAASSAEGAPPESESRKRFTKKY